MKSVIWRFWAYKFFLSLHFFGAVLVPFFTDWGGLTRFQMLLIQSWFMLWIFLLEVPTGAIADYFGRKYSLGLGALVVSVGAVIYGSTPNVWIFLLGEFMFALAFALASGADEAWLYDTLKSQGKEHESKKLLGRLYSINMLGIMLAAPFGSLIATRFDLNYPMIFSGIPFLIAGLLAWSLPEPKIHSDVSERERYMDVLKSGLAFWWSHAQLKIMALDAIGVATAAYFVIWFYQPLLQMAHIPLAYFGWFHALFVAAEIVVAANFVKLEKLAGSATNYLRLTALVTGVMFLVVAWFPDPIVIGLFVLLAGGFGLSRLQFMSIHMHALIPSDKRATVISSVSMLRRFALVIAGPLMGFMSDISLRGSLVIIALLPLAVFLFSPVRKILK